MPRSVLLPLLASGDFCSGQVLADALGVSRTAVWKQVNKLAVETGLEIESVKGKGYRIPGGVELLDAARIRAGLAQQAAPLLSSLNILESVDSTNAEAMRQLEAVRPPGVVHTAEQQTAGRGRRGRQWVSPFARNLYLSVVWEFGQGAGSLEGLSLAVGVAVARALRACDLPPVQLKWPNDVLHGGKKLGGILLEMAGDVAGPCQVVVGLGLNVAMPPSAAREIDQAWTDLATMAGHDHSQGQHPGRNALFSALLNEILPLLATFENAGFGAWREQWQDLDAYADKPVVLDASGHRVAGIARGVDHRGALQLETTTGMQSMFGGELSLRPAS